MRQIPEYLRAVFYILSIVWIQACGGGGGGPALPAAAAPAASQTGTIVVGLTDAEGDFVRYAVDVTSIALHRQDGTRVETLPLTTRVDFAELVEVTELVTVATVPAGIYDSVSLGLDFSGAEVIVQDELGNAIEARIVDDAGAAIESLTVRLKLAGSDVIRIAPGIPAAFSLDFDLDASNDIDLLADPVTVRVAPFLLASAELEADRHHRVRGLLRSVDAQASEFAIGIRPFRHRSGGFGALTVRVDDETVYEIDGQAFQGNAGIRVLNAAPASTPVIAGGEVTSGSFRANRVLAGSSVPWTGQDVVRGVIVRRTADVLTLRGAQIEYRDGLEIFRGELEVLVGDDTRVTALGLANDSLNKNSLSVGQRVFAFGSISEAGNLDATSSLVRMELSQLTGSVTQAVPLAVAVHSMNARRPGIYDFTGTGLLEDADPMFYEIDTASLPLSGVEIGDLVGVRGHVSSFGMAPPDFLARSVMELQRDLRAASFLAAWSPVDDTMPLSIDPGRIELDLEDARSWLKFRGMSVGEIEAMALIAPPNDRGVYAIRVRGESEIKMYRQFSAVVSEMIEQLQAGKQLRRLGAMGGYNREEAELTTRRATFDFIVPGDSD